MLTAGKTEPLSPRSLVFDQGIWREQILTRIVPFSRNPLHELRLSGTSSVLSYLLFHSIQPFCAAFEHEPIAAVIALGELSRRPGANYLVHNARRLYYQGASLLDRELRLTPELRTVLDELALELRTLHTVLQRLSNPRVEWLRRAMVQDLAPYAASQDFQHLRHQLADPLWQSRFAELQNLRVAEGKYGAAELALLGECLHDSSSHVRSSAARLLGMACIRLPELFVRQMLAVAVHDGDLETRVAAARALGGLRAQVVSGAVLQELQQLLNDDDSFVRSATALVIGQLGEAITAPEISERLAELLFDPDAYVREAAARALGRMGAQAAGAQVLARLSRAVEDGDVNVHDAALEALSRLRSLRATRPLPLTAPLEKLAF